MMMTGGIRRCRQHVHSGRTVHTPSADLRSIACGHRSCVGAGVRTIALLVCGLLLATGCHRSEPAPADELPPAPAPTPSSLAANETLPSEPARAGEALSAPASAPAPTSVERADEAATTKAKSVVKARSANATHGGGAAPSRAALPAVSAAPHEPSRYGKESAAAADNGDSVASTKKAPARPSMKDENPYPVTVPAQRPKMKDENPYPASTQAAPASNMKNESPYGQ